MHTLIIYCHPWEGSFNHAVLEALVARLEREGKSYELIDLYADGFEPAMSVTELAGYGAGAVHDLLVERYQKLVAEAQNLAIVCPIWWNDVPAMLRGFFDKVMLIGFSWEATGAGLRGTLEHLASCDLYTTSAEPTEHLEAAIRSSFIEGTLAQLGIGGLPERRPGNAADGAPELPRAVPARRWHNFGSIDLSTPEQRAAWLAQI